MTIEIMLKNLFDFQKFERNDRLQNIIDSATCTDNLNRELCDNELDLFAAGDPDIAYLGFSEKDDD